MKCIHCGLPVDANADGSYSHVIGVGSRLNRCQDPKVPYGHNAHPNRPCPHECLGAFEDHREGGCTHFHGDDEPEEKAA